MLKYCSSGQYAYTCQSEVVLQVMSSVELYPIMHMFVHPENSAGLIAYDSTGYGLIRSQISDPRKSLFFRSNLHFNFFSISVTIETFKLQLGRFHGQSMAEIRFSRI